MKCASCVGAGKIWRDLGWGERRGARARLRRYPLWCEDCGGTGRVPISKTCQQCDADHWADVFMADWLGYEVYFCPEAGLVRDGEEKKANA